MESRRIASAVLVALVAAAVPPPAPGQMTKVAGMRTIDLPLLLDLPGDRAYVRYTPGSLDRSASIQARFELFTREFERSGFARTTLVLYVLSRDDWREAGLAEPYGLPRALDADAIAVPGWADEAVVQLYQGLLGGDLPVPLGQPMLMTPAEAGALAVSDLLTQVEAARAILRRGALAADAPWIAPLLAHVAARLAWDRFEPGRMREIAPLFDLLAANDRAPGGHRLDDWSDALPFETRAWFDARFLRGADLLVAETSDRRLWNLIGKAMSGKEPLTEAALVKKYPELVAWRAANFAPRSE